MKLLFKTNKISDLSLLSQEISQDSQEYLPRGQKRLQKMDIKVARKDFNDKLIVKNNVNNSDEGVKKVLLALNNDTNLKVLKNVKKDKLLATIAFLKGITLDKDKAEFSKLKWIGLKREVVVCYDMLIPQQCTELKKIYNIEGNFGNARYFICAL